MAIVMRQGEYEDFIPSKMLPGEWAVVLADDPIVPDGKSVFIAFAAGDVKRMATYEDMKDLIGEATDDIRDQYILVFNKINDDTAALEASARASATAAQTSQTAAAGSASQAAQSAGAAADFSKESESHSHGGTGTRPGEDTDNSKYYSQQSKLEYERAKEEADRAEKFSGFVTPDFLMANNQVYIKIGGTVDFILLNNQIYYKMPD